MTENRKPINTKEARLVQSLKDLGYLGNDGFTGMINLDIFNDGIRHVTATKKYK